MYVETGIDYMQNEKMIAIGLVGHFQQELFCYIVFNGMSLSGCRILQV